MKSKQNIMSVLVGLYISLLLGCSGADDAKTRLDYGIELYDSGEYTKARLELKSAVQEDNTLAKGYYYLALINEQDKKFRAMLQNLKRAVNLDPNYYDARLRLGKLLLLSGDINAAQEQLEKILEISGERKEGLVFQATLLNKQDKKDAAKAIIEKILQEDPSFVEAVTMNAMFLMQEKKYDAAQAQLQPLIDQGSKHVPLHMVKILLDAKKNDYDAVINDYKEVIAHYPENDELKYALSKLYVQTDRQQEAEQLLTSLVEENPDQVLPKLRLLELLFFYDEAKGKTKLDAYLNEYSQDPEKLVELSSWMLQKKMYAQSQELLENLDLSAMNDAKKITVKLILAKLDFQKRDLEKANQTINEILVIKPEHWPAKILRAKILVANKKYQDASELLNKVFWANPRSDEPLALMAQIDLITNNPIKAEKKFREVLTLNPANQLALQYIIKQELKNNRSDYANELLSKALQRKPKDLDLIQKATQIKMLMKDWAGAKQYISVLDRLPGGQIYARFLQGKVLQLTNECAKSIVVFEQLLSAIPNHAKALQELARCYEILKQRPQLQQYLHDFIKEHPKNINARLLLSDLYLADKNKKQAEAILKDMLAINGQVTQAYVNLSRIYRSKNELKKSIAICKEGLVQLPNNLTLSLALASSYEKVGQYEDAIAIYERLHESHPGMNLIVNNLAALLIDHRSDNQSKQRALELASSFENLDQPYFLDTYAWVLVQHGELVQAISILEKINLKITNEPVFGYHLGVAYYKQGNNAAAIVSLRRAQSLGKKKGNFVEADATNKLLDKLL